MKILFHLSAKYKALKYYHMQSITIYRIYKNSYLNYQPSYIFSYTPQVLMLTATIIVFYREQEGQKYLLKC